MDDALISVSDGSPLTSSASHNQDVRTEQGTFNSSLSTFNERSHNSKVIDELVLDEEVKQRVKNYMSRAEDMLSKLENVYRSPPSVDDLQSVSSSTEPEYE